MAQIEQLQRALKELINFFFTDFVRGKEGLQIEIGKSAIRNARRQQLPQTARINGAKFANFLENHAAQRILKHAWIEQPANLAARSAFDQHRAQETQRVFFQQRPACGFKGHRNRFALRWPTLSIPNQSYFMVFGFTASALMISGEICCRISASTRDQTAGSQSISVWVFAKARSYQGYSVQRIGFSL